MEQVYIVWGKKVQKSYLSWHRRVMQNLKRNWLVVQNWHKEFDKFWPEHLEVSKICTLMGSFRPKYIIFELKKYRGVIFHDTEEWCKIWRKTDLLFEKWQEEFGKFSPEHSKVPKLRLWWDPLNWLIVSKLTWEIWWVLTLAVSKLCTLMGSFWPKYIIFGLKKYWGVMFDSTEGWCKISK